MPTGCDAETLHYYAWFYSAICVLLWPFQWKPSIFVNLVGRRLDSESYGGGWLKPTARPEPQPERLWGDECLDAGGGAQSIICTPGVQLGLSSRFRRACHHPPPLGGKLGLGNSSHGAEGCVILSVITLYPNIRTI